MSQKPRPQSSAPVRITQHLEEPEEAEGAPSVVPSRDGGNARPASSSSRMSARGEARLSVMGCGRGTEALGRAVNNYRDVPATERGAALTAATHTQGTVRRWRSVRSAFMISLLTVNYGLSYESTETEGIQQQKLTELWVPVLEEVQMS